LVGLTLVCFAQFIDTQTGLPVGKNEVGELCVRGPQNMKGYFNNERATNEMISKDGWLHTGWQLTLIYYSIYFVLFRTKFQYLKH